MHAGSPNRFSTTDPLTNSECAAKSLFRNILAVSPCGSRFCPDPALSLSSKCLRMNILATSTKKYRGGSEAKSLSQNILAVSPCGSGFCADRSIPQSCKSLIMNILWEMKKKISKRSPYFGGIGFLEAKSRFLHSAIACAPAPVGMTTLGSTSKLEKHFGGKLGGACEPTLHGVRVHQTGLLELEAAAREYGEVRNASDVVSGCQFRVLLGVDLQHDGSASEVSRDLRNVGRRHPAGATPRRPEIDQDRNFAGTNNIVEVLGADLKGLSHRRQRGFAGTASSGVGKVFRRNPIRLPARWAISGNGHGEVLHRISAFPVSRQQADRGNRGRSPQTPATSMGPATFNKGPKFHLPSPRPRDNVFCPKSFARSTRLWQPTKTFN